MRHAGSFVVTMMLAALPLYACAGSMETESDAGPTPTQDGGTQSMTGAEVHTNVRDGFVAEAQWMRTYGVAALANGPDAQPAFDRLSATEAQIVQQVEPFSGDDGAVKLSQLLHARANAFADLVTSMNSKAASTAMDPQAMLDANAQQIADYFAALCPNAFPGNAATFLQKSNRSMAAGLVADAAQDSATAVNDFDAAQVASMQFADAVGLGIASTFNAVLAPATTSRIEDALTLDFHMHLGDLAFWMRAYVVDHLNDSTTSQPELDRSVKASMDMGSVLVSYFGVDVGGQMEAYIHADTTNAIAFVIALESGDQATVDAISAQWDGNANTFALYLQSNAGVDQATAQSQLRTIVDRERAMILAREAQQWDAEAADYQNVIDARNAFGDLFAGSVVAKFPPSH
jgi:hypothetical protein